MMLKKYMLISAMICGLILSGCGGTASDPTEEIPTAEQGEATKLATCLTEGGWKMYGTEWCGHCKNQKKLFGDAFASVEYIDCDAQKPACQAAGIQGFPTRKSPAGDAYPGMQSLEKLASLGQCEG